MHHPKLGERSSLERSPGSAESISEFWKGTAAGLDGLLKWPARRDRRKAPRWPNRRRGYFGGTRRAAHGSIRLFDTARHGGRAEHERALPWRATGLESKQNPRKGPRVTDGVLQPRRCGSSWEWFVQYPRRRITRPVRRTVLVARLAPRRAVRPTLRAPRRARRTAAWVQSVSRSASMGVEGDATLGRDSGVRGTPSGRGAASTEDAAARMVGATAKLPKSPSKNVRRSMGVPLVY